MSNRDDTGRETVSRQDLEEDSPHVGFGGIDEDDDPMRLEAHQRLHPHDRAHVNLTQDEYTPEEIARMIGTTVDNVMHDIRAGDLKAQRAGRDVICIKRADVIEWLARRGGV
jgi:excisionase family DNA binding protein